MYPFITTVPQLCLISIATAHRHAISIFQMLGIQVYSPSDARRLKVCYHDVFAAIQKRKIEVCKQDIFFILETIQIVNHKLSFNSNLRVRHEMALHRQERGNHLVYELRNTGGKHNTIPAHIRIYYGGPNSRRHHQDFCDFATPRCTPRGFFTVPMTSLARSLALRQKPAMIQ